VTVRRKFRQMGKAICAAVLALFASTAGFGQRGVDRDPQEPQGGKPAPKLLPPMASGVARREVDEKGMSALIHELVSCGTRLTLSSWTDPQRGIGCGRDHIVARFNEIANASGGKLQVVVDKFASKSERTGPNAAALENVYGILPGSDPKLAKTIFIVSGHAVTPFA
jgi:hypothetical protein